MTDAENYIDPFNSTPEDFEDPIDEEELWTCCYPERCLMPGAHTRAECHTVEDAEAYYAEVEGIPGAYRVIDCPNCKRNRVQTDGVCDKCLWDADGGNYALVTRPTEYDAQGPIFTDPNENLILHAST